MQLAPDGRIYLCSQFNNSFNIWDAPIDIIHNPDVQGTNCNFNRGAMNIATILGSGKSVPNFPNFRLGPVDGSACDTLGLDAAIADVSSYLLDFDTTLVGTTKTKSVTIYNRGVKDMTIRNPFIHSANSPYTFNPASPTVTLHTGDSIVYSVSFHPTMAIDTFYADLRIPHNGNWGLVNVALRGIGVWPVGVTSPTGEPVSYHVYPNPAQESFTLGTTGGFGLNSRVVLSNMLGQVVLQQDIPAGWNRYNISLAMLPVGVYACTVLSGDKVEQVIKLVKQTEIRN
jgi:hypothetical protein